MLAPQSLVGAEFLFQLHQGRIFIPFGHLRRHNGRRKEGLGLWDGFIPLIVDVTDRMTDRSHGSAQKGTNAVVP